MTVSMKCFLFIVKPFGFYDSEIKKIVIIGFLLKYLFRVEVSI